MEGSIEECAFAIADPSDTTYIETRIDVILEESEDEQIRLTISDDGIGLPATLGDEHGSTLGLRLVRALAQQIGGDLVVTRPSKGTSFTLTFPLEGAR
jgi:two-component sensor histidine kinase